MRKDREYYDLLLITFPDVLDKLIQQFKPALEFRNQLDLLDYLIWFKKDLKELYTNLEYNGIIESNQRKED